MPFAVECVFINKEINKYYFGNSHLNIHVLVSVFCVFYEFRAYKLLDIVFANKIISYFSIKNLEHTIKPHTDDQEISEFCVLYSFQKARKYICYKETAKFNGIYCAAI